MPACVVVDENGILHQVETPVDQCTGFVLSTRTEWTAFQASIEPFDYAQATAFWSFAFSTVLVCWLGARGAGVLLGLIRKG